MSRQSSKSLKNKHLYSSDDIIPTLATVAGTAALVATISGTLAYFKGKQNVDKDTEVVNIWRQQIPTINIVEKLESKLDRDEDEDDEDRVCIICFSQKKKVILIPCEHMSMCVQCSLNTYNNKRECPECRKKITDVHVSY